MNDEKTRDELLEELADLKRMIDDAAAGRAQAEQTLRACEERYGQLVASVTDYIYTVELDHGSILSTRHGAACIAVTGYSSEDYAADTHLWYKMIYEEDRSAVIEQAERVLRDEEVPPLEHRIRHKDGSIRWVRNSPIKRRDKQGRLIAYDGLVSNITERKRLEEAFFRSKQLESIGILAGGIAHDFNNLLSIILGNISFARMHFAPGDRIFSFLADAEKACEQARELSYRLLTFSKGGEPVKKVSAIGSLVRESAALALSGSNISCELFLPEGLWPVDVDQGQIRQVLNNLLINAKEAMPNGGMVEVSADNENVADGAPLPLGPGRYLKLTVRDHGTGIAEDHIAKIFDPYFTTKGLGSAKGMGLGLTICHSIITKHGGTITVESAPGEGSAFHLYLPAAAQPAAAAAVRAGSSTPQRGSGRVLLMDDERGVRDIAGQMLELLGYTATTVADGGAAIAEYRAAAEAGRPYAAVILDLTVQGGMGGREAMRTLQGFDPSVKGIVSSGYANDPMLADYGDFGFCGAIAKPYSAHDLGAVLCAVLAPRRESSAG